MPDTFAPTIPPQENANGGYDFRIRKAQYGDGYTQRAAKGLNNRKQKWNFTFVGTNAEITLIKDFLDTQYGATSFYYTPPFAAAAILMVVESYAIVAAAASNATISATFEEA